MSFQKRNSTLKRIQRLKHLENEMTTSVGATYLLNCLAYVYFNKPFAKDIWNTLEDQYKEEEKLSKFISQISF